jgi:hypothetical protein
MSDHRKDRIRRRVAASLVAVAALVVGAVAAPGQAAPTFHKASGHSPAVKAPKPHFTKAAAHDRSAPLRVLAQNAHVSAHTQVRAPADRGRVPGNSRFTGDSAVQRQVDPHAVTTFPIQNFEGISNQDNFNIYGGRVNPPDPVGDVGKNQYVEMVNLAFAVYSKTGGTLLGPTPIGALWDGFAIPDCTDPSGDPIVLYDQLANRWILTQFTTSGLDDPSLPFYNCVAISTSPDATGSYYRYAFTTGFNFPDYPKYGVWSDSYVITTREFGPTTEYGIGVYGLEKSKMLHGKPARSVSFFIDGNDPALLPLIGDGLLPADIDGKKQPANNAPIPLAGTQDDDYVYGATSDAVNMWDLAVKWSNRPTASLTYAAQLPVASFDSNFPCGPDSRDCLAQPGITDPAQFLDILSYRQRPTWRLAYRKFNGYESMVTNQSVEAAPGVAGVRWYEIRRINGAYSIYQQGTYAPNDGVNRWMGSIAQDKRGNFGLGYSVVNGTDVFPGIRFTGRFAGDPLGTMTLGEGKIVIGTGVQTTTNSRWGDYTSMNVDPVDDCTFWYVNEYYTAAGQASSTAGWQTRIASFKMPGC